MAIMTKAQQIEKYLLDAIAEKRWLPGERLPAEEELLSELSVSRTTLRNALFSLASDGVLIRRHGSGTYLSQGVKVGTVAILATADGFTPMTYFYSKVLEEARRRIESRGYRPVATLVYGDTAEEMVSSIHILDKPVKRETVGVLGCMNMEPIEKLFAENGIPCVTLADSVATGSYCVSLDYSRMLELGAAMLRAYGHEDFALMCYDYSETSHHQLDQRIDDEFSRMHKNAVGFRDERLVSVPWTPTGEGIVEAFGKWWRQPNRAKAMFFSDDALFDIASRTILEMGIKVPEELAVLSLAHVGKQFHFPIPVSGIGFDPEKLVEAGWTMLDKLIMGEPVEDRVAYIPPCIRKGRTLGELAP